MTQIFNLVNSSNYLLALNTLRKFGEIQVMFWTNSADEVKKFDYKRAKNFFKNMQLPDEEFLFLLSKNSKYMIIKREILQVL